MRMSWAVHVQDSSTGTDVSKRRAAFHGHGIVKESAMACNCGGSLGSAFQNRLVPASTPRSTGPGPTPIPRQTGKKYCPTCRTYAVKPGQIVVRCPICHTTFSAA